MNNIDDLPLATDEECEAHRKILISMGVIKPNASKFSIEIKRERKEERKCLIFTNIISPKLCSLPKNIRVRSTKEEGEYNPQKINTNAEYYIRRQVYFRMLQEILRARRDLKLVLAPKEKKDPEWIF